MICPECGNEFRWHVTVCPTCDVELVERLPGPPPTPDAELVLVFKTGEAAVIPVAQSLLEAADIQYLLRGDGLQDLFGWGRLFVPYNFVVGPAEFWVCEDDADQAREILTRLNEPVEPAPDTHADDEERG